MVAALHEVERGAGFYNLETGVMVLGFIVLGNIINDDYNKGNHLYVQGEIDQYQAARILSHLTNREYLPLDQVEIFHEDNVHEGGRQTRIKYPQMSVASVGHKSS